jgi:hypothetical protein
MSKQFTARAINQPIELDPDIDCVHLIERFYLNGPSGTNVWLDEEELARYNADPDQFTAAHFGFSTVDEYREWVACNNAALCSERTKSGKLCGNSIGMTYRPENWRARHRSGPCFLHAKKKARS